MRTHFVDLRLLLTRPKDAMVVGKLNREILRQFQIEIPVQNPQDAEQIMDLLVLRLTNLFEQLGKAAEEPSSEADAGAGEGNAGPGGEVPVAGEGDASGLQVVRGSLHEGDQV